MKLKSVGIEDIRYPVKIRQKIGGHQNTVATIALRVNMPSSHRETCISAFIRILNKYQDDLSVTIFPDLLREVKEELQAASARMEMTFPYLHRETRPGHRHRQPDGIPLPLHRRPSTRQAI